MKAAVLNHANSRFQIENIEIDAPGRREVLIEVKASGLCHSDLHIAESGLGLPLPAVFGHELAGVVKEVGPGVREFAAGDHVVASLVRFCGHCASCLGGFTFRCLNPDETLRAPAEKPRLARAGQPVTPMFGTAAFAEYALVHENQLVRVPEELPFAQAAILGCGTITGAGAVINTAGIKPGESVAVIGAGGVGLNLISGARLAGAARIIAIDAQPKKEKLARKFGATDFIAVSNGSDDSNGSENDPVEAVRALSGKGVDHAFEVVGLKTTTEQVIRMVRVGGGVYLIGLHKPGSTIEINVLGDLLMRQARIVGVYMGSSNIKKDIPMYAQLYLQGRLNLDDLISREINLSQINEAYDELRRGEVARCVITSF